MVEHLSYSSLKNAAKNREPLTKNRAPDAALVKGPHRARVKFGSINIKKVMLLFH